MKILHTFCLALIFISSQSHARVVINVNTTTDENGENGGNCSLREAIQSVNTQQAFGGCIAGERFGTNVISLQNAIYTLPKGAIQVSHDVTIQGATLKTDEIDSITFVKPKRTAPTTQINGNSQRIFNTSSNTAALTLQNLLISNGKADIGGAILAGGPVTLSNTVLSDNEATVAGGAIYLSGRSSTLSADNSTFRKNKGNQGAVLGMSCFDHLSPVTRTIIISGSSLINNGSIENNSIIEGCGAVTMSVETSTIAQNTAKVSGGILYFVDNLDSFSSLTLLRVTMAENHTAPVLSYGQLGDLAIASSIIAFNDVGCSAKNNSTTLYNGGESIGGFNTLQNCSLQYLTTNTLLKTDIILDEPSHADASFATELNPLANYGGYTDVYLPKTTSKYILNRAPGANCEIDQRGSQNLSSNTCDTGSVERRTVVAVFDIAKVVINKDDSDRIAEVDALANDRVSETETTRGDFGKDPVTGNYLIELTENANNRCSIVNREGERPLVRFDNKGTPMQEPQVTLCKYRFTDNNGNQSNEGELRFRITNKPPVATDDTYSLPSGSTELSLNLLSNDNDKNDGIYGGLCTDANNVNCNGFYLRVVSQPSVGVIIAEKTGNCPDSTTINQLTCYGGKISYRPNNIQAPFNDKFTYVVYDIDKTSSNTATVTIINETGANEETSTGSLGLFSLFGLTGFAFYRRFRKSYVA